MNAKTLRYSYQVQSTFYYCGPAATRVALSAKGVIKSQDQVAAELRTTENGTDSSNDVVRVLNANLGPWYVAKFISGQDATPAEQVQFKADVVSSIDAGVAVVCNIVGSSTDTSGRLYSYNGGHYLTIVGYRNDGAEALVADVAIREYWMKTANIATWVAQRGYSTSKVSVPASPTPPPASASTFTPEQATHFEALCWRVEAIINGRDTVADGPSKGEPNKFGG